MEKILQKIDRIIKIGVTGPESSGKTELAKELSSHYQTFFVPEYARTYLETHGSSYAYDDVVHIIENHFKQEKDLISLANRFLFYDTEWINFKIWLKMKYNQNLDIVDEAIKRKPFDFYLLMYPDLMWKEDPLREMPKKSSRLAHFEMFFSELQSENLDFAIIRGQGEERTEAAIKAIEQFFD